MLQNEWEFANGWIERGGNVKNMEELKYQNSELWSIQLSNNKVTQRRGTSFWKNKVISDELVLFWFSEENTQHWKILVNPQERQAGTEHIEWNHRDGSSREIILGRKQD